VIIAGDFNLEPSGGNKAAPNATAWDALIAVGFESATGPFACKPGTYGATAGHLCESEYTTAVVGKGCAFPCIGYQLDWVIYRKGPFPAAADAATAEAALAAARAALPSDRDLAAAGPTVLAVSPTAGVRSELGSVAGPSSLQSQGTSTSFCSDHSPIMVEFDAASIQ
jgi:hypothetical protein